MIGYCIMIGLLNMLLSTYSLMENNLGVFMTTLCMFFVQDLFCMTIVGLYTVEVTTNTTIGIIGLLQNLIFLTFGFILPHLVNSMGVVSMHFMFGGIILLGNLPFVIKFVKETAGLTDREKKSLYYS